MKPHATLAPLIVLLTHVSVSLAAPLDVVTVEDPAIACKFAADCGVSVGDSDPTVSFSDSPGTGFLQSREWPAGEAGTVGESLHPYLYRVDARNLTAVTSRSCIVSLTIDFGPVAQLDYNDDGTPDDVFVVTRGGLGNVTVFSAEQVGDEITFVFSPGVCAGDTSYLFGLASKSPPETTTATLDMTLTDDDIGSDVTTPALFRASGSFGGDAPRPFHRADVNGSGDADLSDAVFLLEYLFLHGDAPSCRQAADSNADDQIDLSDAVQILLWLFGGGNSPAAPFRDCGIDPQSRSLSCERYDACATDLPDEFQDDGGPAAASVEVTDERDWTSTPNTGQSPPERETWVPAKDDQHASGEMEFSGKPLPASGSEVVASGDGTIESPAPETAPALATDEPASRWLTGKLAVATDPSEEATLTTALESLLRERGKEIGVPDLRGLKALPAGESPSGAIHLVFRQVIGGLPVEGRGLSAHFDRDGVLRAVEANTVDLPAPPTQTMTATSAAKMVDGETQSAELVIDPTSGRPAWVVRHGDGSGQRSTIDASTGQILRTRSTHVPILVHGRDLEGRTRYVEGCPAPTVPAVNLRNPVAQAEFDSYRKGPLNLVRVGRGRLPDVFTLDASSRRHFSSRSRQFADTTRNRKAISVHGHLTYTVDQLANRFLSRHGLWAYAAPNWRLGSVIATIDVPGEVYAHWDADNDVIVFGGDPPNDPDVTHVGNALDVVAHEYAHAIAVTNVRLGYDGHTPGMREAIHEGFADAVGFLVDADADVQAGRPIDWTIGEDAYRPGTRIGIRHLANPRLIGMPDAVHHPVFGVTEDPHVDGAVIGKVFHLLVEGGVHYGVLVRPLHPQALATPEGHAASRERAGRLLFEWMLINAMPENANFADARRAMETAVHFALPEVRHATESVANAWAAVGVGRPARGVGSCLMPYSNDFEFGLDDCWDSRGFANVSNFDGGPGLELGVIDIDPEPGVDAAALLHLSLPPRPANYFASFRLANVEGDPVETYGTLDLSVDGGITFLTLTGLATGEGRENERHIVPLVHPAIAAGLVDEIVLAFRADCSSSPVCGVRVDDLIVGSDLNVDLNPEELDPEEDQEFQIDLGVVRLDVSADVVNENDPPAEPADQTGFWITITRPEPLDTVRTFVVSVTGADAGEDWRPTFEPRFSFTPGENQAQLFVEVLDDELYEYDETLTIGLEEFFPGFFEGEEDRIVPVPGAQRRRVVIHSDDPPPVIRIETGDRENRGEIRENGSTRLYAHLDRLSGEEVDVVLSFGGSATHVSDYRLAERFTISPGRGFRSPTRLNLHGVLDSIEEGPEIAVIGFASVTGAEISEDPAEREVQITLRDAPGVILVVGRELEEGGDDGIMAVLASRGRRVTAEGDVTILLRKSGPASGDVRLGSGGRITIPNGATEGHVAISAIEDDTYELDDSVHISIGEIHGFAADYVGGDHEMRILNDDLPPLVSFRRTSDSVHEGMRKTIDLSVSRDSEQSVNFWVKGSGPSTSDFSTAPPPTDHRGIFLSLPPGTRTRSVALIAENDLEDEPYEEIRFKLFASNTHARVDSREATFGIIDRPFVSSLRTDRTRVPFGESHTITAELSYASARDITVHLRRRGRSGSIGGGSERKVIPRGNTTATFRVGFRPTEQSVVEWFVRVRDSDEAYPGRYTEGNGIRIIYEARPEPEPECDSPVPPARPGYRETFGNSSLRHWRFVDDREGGGYHSVAGGVLILSGTGSAEQHATLHVDFSGRSSGRLTFDFSNSSANHGGVEISSDGRTWGRILPDNNLILPSGTFSHSPISVSLPRDKLGPCTQIRFWVTSSPIDYGLRLDNVRID